LLRDPAGFRPWFDRILVNLCRDRLRRGRIVRFVPVDAEARERPALDAYDRLIGERDLLAAIDRLDVDLRVTVILRYWADLTVDDIADRLAIPAGTLKSRLHRAIGQMRSRLGEGAVFGEMALLSAQPRSASVGCVTEVDLLEVGRQSLASLADELGAVAEALHGFTRERLLGNLMAVSPLFRPFNRMQQRDLLRRFTSHDVSPGTVVINEGEEGRGLFVVLSGELDVSRRTADGSTVPLGTLKTGDVFG
jgi:CRP-like cAMP-binding protein